MLNCVDIEKLTTSEMLRIPTSIKDAIIKINFIEHFSEGKPDKTDYEEITRLTMTIRKFDDRLMYWLERRQFGF